MVNVLIFHAYSNGLKNTILIVKYIGAGSEDSLQEPILHKTYSRPDSISKLQRTSKILCITLVL